MAETARGARTGSYFGPYYLKRLLGSGGMGEVYEAEHTAKQWTVAVKLLSAAVSQDPVFRKRLQREARLAGRLQEPHVLPIHDYGEIDGQLFIEMRRVQGTDLDDLLKRFGPLPPPRAAAIIHQIASALDAAHAAGVMHRDIKPQNILVTPDDFAYLVDFGIASATTDERLTQLGTAVGTWKYMAPERFSDAEVTYRADIYALACVLHECLTGVPPYRADSAGVLINAHLHAPIPQPSRLRPGIPQAFDDVIARGMAKNPQDRYASAGDLALAAHHALSTPDQDHAARLLRRSHESSMPNKFATPTAGLSAGAFNSPPTPQPAAAPPYLPHNDFGPRPYQAPAASPNWAPTSGRQPQQFSGPGWPAPPYPPRPPSARRNPWPVLAVVIVFVIAVLSGLSIWLLTRSDDSEQASGEKTTTTTSRTTAATTSTTTSKPVDANARLLSLLPKGYGPGVCVPEHIDASAVWHNALAIAQCGAPSDPGGPINGLYALFPDVGTLKDAFVNNTETEKLQSVCPQGKASPGDWWDNDNPGVVLGQIECLQNGSSPEFEWSNTRQLLIGSIMGSPQGPSLDDLYTWWSKYS